ncbi:hypothetical protein HELRODRAFT_192279 [Helobdella robusta]|uniref:Uncharacterized protein n=1 Tax=Helobdella robusta TaxID=6412 RepID=T1FTS5_HELRO|nr:hypothetical protein HELRODRAFT_192279 [Helobdella robusta]ESO01283.1 hypothetical protein HELRODRAFT_192279 [Helobdella robusta]
MKKRRELDALLATKSSSSSQLSLGRGSGSNNRIMRNGSHELLRNDSYSSECDEYLGAGKELLPRKSSQSNKCFICLLLLLSVLILACGVVILCLTWMFVHLKKEIHVLKDNLNKGEIMDLNARINVLTSRLDEMDQKLSNKSTNNIKNTTATTTTTNNTTNNINNKFISELNISVSQMVMKTKELDEKLFSIEKHSKADRFMDNVMNQTVSDIGREVVALKNDVTALKGDVTALKGDVTTLKNDVITMSKDPRHVNVTIGISDTSNNDNNNNNNNNNDDDLIPKNINSNPEGGNNGKITSKINVKGDDDNNDKVHRDATATAAAAAATTTTTITTTSATITTTTTFTKITKNVDGNE